MLTTAMLPHLCNGLYASHVCLLQSEMLGYLASRNPHPLYILQQRRPQRREGAFKFVFGDTQNLNLHFHTLSTLHYIENTVDSKIKRHAM